ncbi:NADH-quinone oxidoreductase subunit J [Salsipaludibacter albus]|uniref:NADH-quinone oxidoreductase subunit J n=1 Tax=Salsipaludibacter albus TaxID=2849650 RepID=UPI001EE408E0|nr:NADH-quinone oxidoreductase subunit J [Salsipaludibacter albus]MBY5161050.1 NADH-quinone oxidoreductase subunit J [Salsipaludibacter albus]
MGAEVLLAPVLAQASDGLAAGFTTEVVLFVVFGGLAIGSGIAMVSMRNVVHGALMLVLNLLSIAGLYLVLESAFLSVVQIIVYAGAVMVLFLFVIMLLGVDRDDLLVDVRPVTRIAAGIAAVAVVGFVGYGLVGPYTTAASVCPAQNGDQPATPEPGTVACVGFADTLAALEADGTGSGSAEIVAGELFTRYTFPFEVAALLLTVATIGAMLLGRRSDPDPEDDPAWVPSMVVGGGPDDDADDDPHDRPDAVHRGDPAHADESDEDLVPAGITGDDATDQGGRDDRPTGEDA